jgi:hypothetical protein
MNQRRNNKTIKVLRTIQPKSRTVAATVEVRLPSIRWTPDLIAHVASLLADTLVRDLQERPPETSRTAS